MITLNPTKCCGMLEINDLSTTNSPLEALRAISARLLAGYDHLGTPKPVPYVIFTGVTQRVVRDHASGRVDNYGEDFAVFLEANGLGPVTRSEARRNWTANTIMVWIWHPDYARVWPFLDAQAPASV